MQSELTSAEKSWIKKLQKVINQCPSDRLGAYTIGDRDIEFFDTVKRDEWIGDKFIESDVYQELTDSESRLFVKVSFPFNIESRAG